MLAELGCGRIPLGSMRQGRMAEIHMGILSKGWLVALATVTKLNNVTQSLC